MNKHNISMSSIFRELSKLILPEYFIITISTILIAGIYNNILTPILLPLIVIFTLIMLGLNTFNSIYDIEIDKLNKPARPTVSGKISKKTVNIIWSSSFILALLIAFIIGKNIFFLTGIGVFVAIAYSIPKIRLRNNFISSGFVGGFIYGALPYLLVNFVSNNPLNLSHMVLFFGILFAITPLKDIEDVFGDRKNKIKSFPVLFGEITTINFSTYSLIIICTTFLVLNINKLILFLPFFIAILICYYLNQFSKRLLTKNYKRSTQSHIVTIAMLSVLLIELTFGLTLALY